LSHGRQGFFSIEMNQNPDYLLVYGTLRSSFTNEAAQFLHQHSRYLGEGTFPGLLFDIGAYPGAIYQPDSITRVEGTVYDIGENKTAILACLDDYEGIGSDYALPYEYTRTVIQAHFNNGRLDCWVYLYNLSTKEKQVILSGDYVTYSLNE
jgi:gamma-glutamylcyclotransferase (GGCT)/AIG2-like uncharacterized protein YtfP